MQKQKKMYPQLNFASVCERDMKKAGKLLSFKAMAYRSEVWAGGTNFGGQEKRANQQVSWRFWRLFFLIAWKLTTVKRPRWH